MAKRSEEDHSLNALMTVYQHSEKIVPQTLVQRCYEIQLKFQFDKEDSKALNMMKSLVDDIVAEKMVKK